ncbi:MAG: SCO family protein [Candidatus Omnitrophica bacterium]|nr:SCO family protein [Candidatus Omnitrophota bacterium]
MKRSFIFALTLSAFLGFILFTIFLFIQSRPAPKNLPVLGEIHDFQLTDQNEKLFSSQQLQGKVWVADLFFTTCGSICPLMNKNMAKLYRSYQLGKNVVFVSISVNPEQDTPAVLQQYARKYQGNQGPWYFLTGSRDEITKMVVNDFKLGTIENPIFHSSKFILVDGQGKIRGYYDGTSEQEITELFKDIAVLMKSL